jgi:hypothetical protein
MSLSTLFLLGLLITAAISLLVVIYLKRPLHRVLVELCGSGERASFWTAFSGVTLTLAPVILAMQYTPELNSRTEMMFQIAEQLKWGLLGLLIAVVILGWVLSRFIPRPTPPRPH